MRAETEIKIYPLDARFKSCPNCGGEIERFRGMAQVYGDAPLPHCIKCNWESPIKLCLIFYHRGKQIKIYSDETGKPLDSRRRARALAIKIRSEIKTHSFDREKYLRDGEKKYQTANLLERFLKFKLESGEIAPSYVDNYNRMVAVAKEYFSEKRNDVREIKKADLQEYLIYLRTKFKYSEKTLKNYLMNFKTFMNWCREDAEAIEVVPKFPKFDIRESETKWLSEEDQTKILEKIPEKDKPIFALMFLSGARPAEVRALRLRNVNMKTQIIRIDSTFSKGIYRQRRKGKYAKPLLIPIPSVLEKYIQGRFQILENPFAEDEEKNLEQWLFVNPGTGRNYSATGLRRIWDKAKEGAGIEGVNLYEATRHSFGSQESNKGESVYMISKMMGHSSVKMTERYTHPDIEKMRVILEKRTHIKL